MRALPRRQCSENEASVRRARGRVSVVGELNECVWVDADGEPRGAHGFVRRMDVNMPLSR